MGRIIHKLMFMIALKIVGMKTMIVYNSTLLPISLVGSNCLIYSVIKFFVYSLKCGINNFRRKCWKFNIIFDNQTAGNVDNVTESI